MANLIVSAVAEWDGRALTKGTKQLSAFERGAKQLGKTLGGVFAVSQVVAFGKASLKAFSEDQASAVKLAKAVDNLGLSFSNPDITRFIATLETQSGIVDEKLRPAFQALLTTTGDVTKAQELLTSAIDISRGSGVDLAQTSQDLANGYVGITRGLKKYNLGLTQAQLKSKSFTEIMDLLNKQFSGASAAYLDTYAGKMDKLTTATDVAKESIGKGLIDAFAMMSGGTGVDGAIKSINDIAGAINAVTTAIGALGAVVHGAYKLFDFIGNLGGLVPKFGNAQSTFGKNQAAAKAEHNAMNNPYGNSTGTMADYAYSQKQKQAAAAKLKADAKALAIQKSLNKVTASTAKTTKQDAMTAKQALLFNQTAISAVAALKGKLSDEERNKVELMLALEMNNVDAAAILSQKVAQAYDQTGQLAAYLRDLPDAANPFAYWDMYLNGIAYKVNAITSPGTVLGGMNFGGSNGGGSTSVPSPNVPTTPQDLGVTDLVTLASQGAGASGGFSPVVAAAMAKAGNDTSITQNFAVTVNNPVGNGIVDMVQQAVLDAGRLGHNLVPAGSL
jgi:hypothetical protein